MVASDLLDQTGLGVVLLISVQRLSEVVVRRFGAGVVLASVVQHPVDRLRIRVIVEIEVGSERGKQNEQNGENAEDDQDDREGGLHRVGIERDQKEQDYGNENRNEGAEDEKDGHVVAEALSLGDLAVSGGNLSLFAAVGREEERQ